MWPRRRWSRRMPKLRLEQCLWRGQANMKFNFVKANKWKAANAAGGASAARSDVQHFSVPSSMMSTTMKPANCSLHFIWPEITGFHIKNTYWTTRQTHAQLSSDQSRPKQTGTDRRNIGRASLSDIRQRCCCCWCRSRFGCSCCCSCCFWCCCEFHFGCFIVVAGIILRHLSQSWHNWLEQSRKQTTQLESWTRRQLGRLDRLDSLGKWTENWTCSPSAARTTGPMNRRYSWRNGCKLYDQHCGYFICWCPVWRQSETLITLFGRTWRANAITAPRYCRSSVNVAVKRFCVVA